jgi:indole-3-glycerol phosphate synthase/phosphoribosylanthranilate isomerase
MENVLDKIVAFKRRELEALQLEIDAAAFRSTLQPADGLFYRTLQAATQQRKKFVIAEFKRRSPTGGINQGVLLTQQIDAYIAAGAVGASVLTDAHFFGGSYADLAQAAQRLHAAGCFALQKDFVIHPLQIYLARQAGADAVLLMAAIHTLPELKRLKHEAEALGMGVLVEVHDAAEIEKIQGLDAPVVGINNRNLRNMKIALNNTAALAPLLPAGTIIVSESGIGTAADFAAATHAAHGALIGTSLMRNSAILGRFTTGNKQYVLKACGLRTPQLVSETTADLIGINFSPRSKRRIDPAVLSAVALPPNAVAVFKGNSEEEIRAVLQQHPFQYVQLYADDVSPAFVQSLSQKVILAIAVQANDPASIAAPYAHCADMFILDGPAPGSGTPTQLSHLDDFPYPFLLAGGIHAGNIHLVHELPHCIGADVASGIETDGTVDAGKIQQLRALLAAQPIHA